PGILVSNPKWSAYYSYVTILSSIWKRRRPVDVPAGAIQLTRWGGYVHPMNMRHVPKPPPHERTGSLTERGYALDPAAAELRDNLFVALHDTGPTDGFLKKLRASRDSNLKALTFPVYQCWDIIWLESNPPGWAPGPWLVISNSQVNLRYDYPDF